MTARRRLLVLLGLGLAFALALVRLGALFSGALVEHVLEGFFERETRVGQVNVHLLPLSAEIEGLRVAGASPASPPFLEIARVVVHPSLGQVFTRQLALRELRLESPRLRINAWKAGGDDLPPFGRGGRPGSGLRLDRLVIQDGEVLLDHERVPVEVDLPDFQGRLDVRQDRARTGRIAFGPGALRFGGAPALNLAAEIALVLEGRRLVVESGRIRGTNLDLATRGEIRFGRVLLGELALLGPVDLAILDQHVVRTGLGLAGDARVDATLRLEGSKVEIAGKAKGTAGSFDTVAIPSYEGSFAWDGHGLRIQGLEVAALGGRAALAVEVPSASAGRPARVEGRIEQIDAEGVLAALFDWGRPQVGTGATGEVAVSWPRGRAREISGRVDVELRPKHDGRTPGTGRFVWSAVDGEQNVELLELRTDVLEVLMDGHVSADDRASLRLDAETPDLAGADDLLRRLRQALGNDEAEDVGIAGSGVFRGRWEGTLRAPVFEGRFTGKDLVWRNVSWGEASAAGSLTPEAIEARSLQLRRGESTLHVDGRFETGDYGVRDALEGRARLLAWPATDLLRALDFRLPVEGPLSGDVDFRGRRSAPEGEARLEGAAGRYLDVPFVSARMKARWSPRGTQVLEAQARLGGGEALFSGTVSEDGVYDGEASLNAVQAEALLGDRLPLPLSGRITAKVTLQGPLHRPRLKGRVQAPRLFLGDEGLGAVEARLEGQGDGEVSVEATCRSGRVDLRLEGRLGATAPHPGELVLTARSTSVDPYLRIAFSALPSALGLVATGELRVAGPLLEPRGLRGEVRMEAFELSVPDYAGRATEPVRARFENGSLLVDDFHIVAEGTDLRLRGEADLLDQGPLDLKVSGDADLRGLVAVSPRLRGFGGGPLEVAVTGTRAEPRLAGSLRLAGAGLRVRGFPHGLEDLTGTVRFTEAGATLEGVKGRLAGGELGLVGELAFAKGRLASFDLRPRGGNMALRWPEGLRSLVDADLRFFGDDKRRFATGTVEIRQAVYSRRYDVASEILATRAESEGATEDGAAEMALDIRLRAPGTVRVDNNLANLAARADLHLRGTPSAPLLIGHAEVERGRIYFQGRTYVIRHGSLDFANPTRLDPLFDVEAETRVQSYRVTLRLNGTLDRVTPTLTSDPPLSAVQILNLLAGADEATVAAMTSTRSNEAQLAASGAATLAAGRISEEVGLERGASKLLGLDRFSIDPSLLRGNGQTPSARVTLGKRITPDLSVIYAQDLSGTGERLMSVEYTLSDRFSLLLTRSDPDGFGFDVRLRRSR
jgi:hypothetical protein